MNGNDPATLRFHDRASQTPLSVFAVGLAIFATLFLMPLLRRRVGSDEWLMLLVALVLFFLAWRCWKFARLPYLTLRADDLVIHHFLKPLQLSYADITAAAVEHTMMRVKKYHPPILVHTFHLALRDGCFAKRVLPFGSDAAMLAAFTERTRIQSDDIRGPEGVEAWKEKQRQS